MSSSKRDKPKWQTLDIFFTKTLTNSTNSDSHAETQSASNQDNIDSETSKIDDELSLSVTSEDHGNRQRRLSTKWLTENPWFRYSMNDDALYCAPCVLFGRQESKDRLFINKVTDWSNLACFVKRYLRVGSPHFIYQAIADDFVKICLKDSKDEAIIYKISEFKKKHK
ncbi:unnamed protein product [Mytilus coruscus]|uniref:TTF-type domain-containing protein n=1 Tax=Mytilus coruscus TaxID=42192 RepID=A0A6J8EKJ6_MYTCO|nr:unnamed protein product [Mytilus coruscus]